MEALLKEMSVEKATCDQCLYGCTAEDGSPVKKPTTFMTNTPELAKELRSRCKGRGRACSRPEGGEHTQCRGKTARMAAVYHFKLCRAILVGFRNQLRKDGTCKDGFVVVLGSSFKGDLPPEPVPIHLVYELKAKDGEILNVQFEGATVYRDDLTGQLLDPELVRAAIQQELEYFEAKQV